MFHANMNLLYECSISLLPVPENDAFLLFLVDLGNGSSLFGHSLIGQKRTLWSISDVFESTPSSAIPSDRLLSLVKRLLTIPTLSPVREGERVWKMKRVRSSYAIPILLHPRCLPNPTWFMGVARPALSHLPYLSPLEHRDSTQNEESHRIRKVLPIFICACGAGEGFLFIGCVAWAKFKLITDWIPRILETLLFSFFRVPKDHWNRESLRKKYVLQMIFFTE